MILTLVDEALACGARLSKIGEVLGLSVRTLQRWRLTPRDGRSDATRARPANALSDEERQAILELSTSPEYRELSPNQIVPMLADQNVYIASESTFYRVLRQAKLQNHRESSRPIRNRHPRRLKATGPNQVWSWDITYLRTPVRGMYFYLYVFLDVWSRKIVGWQVYDTESGEHAAALFERICKAENIHPDQLTLHQDNGSPMKAATFQATLQRLGVSASFSRPSVSNDNAFSESLYRTLKYRPEFPSRPFHSLQQAREWVRAFTHWYNTLHRHSAISFVTPSQRHEGAHRKLLQRRFRLYTRARARNPQRWSRHVRSWKLVDTVELNPRRNQKTELAA